MRLWDAIIWALAIWGTFHARGATESPTSLRPSERAEVEARVRRFYAEPAAPGAMSERPPKRDAISGNARQPRAHAPDRARSRQAILSRARAASENDDKVETLAATWVTSLARDLASLPAAGTTQRALWSDDYWRTKWGLTSYRYADKKEFKTYKEAVAAYAQPADFLSLLGKPSELVSRIARWSPAEKYDLSVGDDAFGLTGEQKREGASMIGPGGDVEEWMGICHGWAAASIMIPAPVKAAELTGSRGVKVTWYPSDVRALSSLMWAKGRWWGNQVGGRCEAKKIDTYPNGRIRQQECFDTNPATLHLVLGNFIGREKLAFIMDSTLDYEVWNQPVHSYELTYFNPLEPARKSKDAAAVAVPYDAAFKAKDRFQSPLTRGVRRADGKYDDSGVQKIVGVIATVVYVDEVTPEAKPVPVKDEYTRVTYTYDLELRVEGGKLLPTGGEWHENAHPDFLWLPRRDTVAYHPSDAYDLEFDGSAEPDEELAETAAEASRNGYPLCQVVRDLVGKSAGKPMYECGR